MNKEFRELLDLEKPQIILNGDVNRAMYNYVGEALILLHIKKCPPVDIILDTGGGETIPGLDIYDLVRLYPGPTKGIVFNRAASMGAVILQACKERCCARHAIILIHHVSKSSVSLDEIEHHTKLKKLKEQLRRPQKRLYTILCDRTGKSEKEIARVCRLDKEMDSEEAKTFGLIDEIL